MKIDCAITSSPHDISQFCNKISANFETTVNWPYEGNDVSANQEFSHCFIAKSIHEIYLHLYDNF